MSQSHHRIFTAFSVILMLLLLGGLVFFNRMIRRGFSARDRPSIAETSLATSMREMAIPSRYKAMKNPIAATPDALHEAMAHWADHCAVCHANNGSGDTMFGRGLYPRPPDMRLQNTQRMSDGELYYTIQNGVRLSGMPAFGEPSDNDLATWKLVVFIRHLPALIENEELEMKKLNPKTPDEIEEEQQEDDFLNGGSSSQSQSHNHPKGTDQ
ncbi:c-type cytochrome [Silvibacterium sp.]|uniref:c-type cytochrome n=1 Tax=Silvibacterium sp. TaxID=1964179 RepID=UPI0039E37E48